MEFGFQLEKLLSEGKVLRERLVCEQVSWKNKLNCSGFSSAFVQFRWRNLNWFVRIQCVLIMWQWDNTRNFITRKSAMIIVSAYPRFSLSLLKTRNFQDSTEDHVQKCIVFSRHGIEKCEQCGHSWKYHTHVRYKLEKTTKTVFNVKVIVHMWFRLTLLV